MLRRLLKDKRGIEGLPMRLIIIVVVAAVVLAAILAMMKYVKPAGTLQVSYEFDNSYSGQNVLDTSSGNVILVDAKDEGMGEVNPISFKINIKVTDTNGKPVSGATVILTGAGTAAAGETDGNGIAPIEVTNAKLLENQETAYMKVEVKASGYNKYIDEEGVILQRVTS
ncbi:MAG: Ig-like domain-containing protein [Thermoplasmata archaeon]|nr:Ig-like domain-containing protein [Thermoplasmata archaeon]